MKFDQTFLVTRWTRKRRKSAVQAMIDTLTKEGVEWTGRTSDMAEKYPTLSSKYHKKEFSLSKDLSKIYSTKLSERLGTKGIKSNLAEPNC